MIEPLPPEVRFVHELLGRSWFDLMRDRKALRAYQSKDFEVYLARATDWMEARGFVHAPTWDSLLADAIRRSLRRKRFRIYATHLVFWVRQSRSSHRVVRRVVFVKDDERQALATGTVPKEFLQRIKTELAT